MAKPPTIYDLVLVISTSADDDARAQKVADVTSAIESGGGRVERQLDWGRRPMTFEIRHQGEGDYHLIQFAGPPALLDSLSHTLRIDDEVLRFRIIKVLPGTPPAPDAAPPVLATATAAAPASDGDS